jgi:cold-inducible RNA-binding protein
MASKVFVGNLNFNTTREEVETLFAQVGRPRDVFMPSDRDTGRPRGFAFVEYENDDEAAQAIERFNGYELGGRPLRVNAAEDRPRQTSRPSFGGPSPYEGGGGGGGGDRFGGGKPKGSRRNIRAKKRTL